MQLNQRVLYFGVFFAATRMLIGATSAVYLLNKGLSIVELSWLKSMQFAILIISDIPLAMLADKYNKKIFILLAMICSGLWLGCSAIASPVAWLYIGEVFNALSIALSGSIFTAYLINSHQQESNESIETCIARYQKVVFFYMALAAAAGAFIFNPISNTLWYVASLLLFSCAFVFAWFGPSDSRQNNPVKAKPILIFKHHLYKIIFHSIFKLNSAVSFSLLILAVLYQIMVQFWQYAIMITPIEHWSQWLSNSGLAYGLLFLAILWVQSIASAIVLRLKDTKNLIFTLNIIACLSVILYAIMDYWVIYFIILFTFFYAKTLQIILAARFHEKINSSRRAFVESIMTTSSRVLIFICLPFVGFLLTKYGLIIITIALTFVALIIFFSKPYNKEIYKI